MTTPSEVFYAARDLRTEQYCASLDTLTRPVTVIVGADTAAHRAGQVAALALINMLARVHRNLNITAPAAPLLARSLVPADNLQAALAATAVAINPFIKLDIAGLPITGAPAVAPISIGIGTQVPHALDIYLGWDCGRGEIACVPTPGGGHPGDVLGAATAACLAATAAFRLAHGQPVRPVRLNLAERTADSAAGTHTVLGPVDVGSVLVIGAGAVSQGLLYWLREFGVLGQWDIVDGDLAKLHNTNRSLATAAAEAGWPHGVLTGPARNKVDIAAAMIDADAHPQWYDEWVATQAVRHDIVLALANERGVRTAVASRGESLLLHATTSANWTAEFHRHVADRDDCPACRLPDDNQVGFACSTGPATPADRTSGDAALPFLSAMSGLLLAVALLQLPDHAELFTGRPNHWRLHLELGHRVWQPLIHPARRCPHAIPPGAKELVQQAQPRRWDDLA